VRERHTLRAVLFDLDDTLFDHRHAARSALSVVCRQHAALATQAFSDLERAHAHVLQELHEQVMAGTLDLDDARAERFRRLFRAAGVVADDDLAASAASAYRAAYLAARQPVAGATALVAALSPRVRLGVVSNNILLEQQEKMRQCGFTGYIDTLVVSEEAGVSKPDPRIFRFALERLGCAPDEAVMIGDSWAADIEGARGAGIRAIWFNRTGETRPAPGADVDELTSLEPISRVLDAIFGANRH
jgi:putative hydrolase of the HAD superfamily